MIVSVSRIGLERSSFGSAAIYLAKLAAACTYPSDRTYRVFAQGEQMSEGAREAGRFIVFLSYSRDDLNFADQLEAALQSHKYDVAIDR